MSTLTRRTKHVSDLEHKISTGITGLETKLKLNREAIIAQTLRRDRELERINRNMEGLATEAEAVEKEQQTAQLLINAELGSLSQKVYNLQLMLVLVFLCVLILFAIVGL